MRTFRNRVFRHVLLTLLTALLSVPAAAQDVTNDPESVRLEVRDIVLFEQILQRIERGEVQDTAAVIENEYLANASPGLKSYAERYEVTGDGLATTMSMKPSDFTDLDALADTILAREDELRSSFRRLQELFPEAVYPPVWFFIGGHGIRGLARPEGVLINAEGLIDSPDELVPLVMHELAHFQQAIVQGIDTYRSIYGPDGTLLALALREGSAELIAELTAGRHINPVAERFGLEHEPELWSRFQEDMLQREPGDWMFVQPSNGEWPPDLGYWIGYRIAKSYYEGAGDKRRAIQDIMSLSEYEDFLRASGYMEEGVR